MPEASDISSDMSIEQWMVEMVHDRIAAGETTVISMAAVLRCGKQIEKLPHLYFPLTASFQKNRGKLRDVSAGDKTFRR
jgi:hypothetical protein